MTDFAMVFPGQGSQKVAMLNALSEEFSEVKETVTQASNILDYDLWELIANGPQTKLDQTEITQPAMLTADVAVWRCWCAKQGPMPKMMAGHSLGEYSALVCAEALDFQQAVALVAERGRLMQQAVPLGEGAMAAIIGLSDQQVADLCQQAGEGQVLSVANFNSLGQVVIAGQAEAVDRAVALAKPSGAKLAKRLALSVPSHCALMAPAGEQLAQYMQSIDFNTPKIPVLHNATLAYYDDPGQIKTVLIKQLTEPVRWVETILQFQEQGIAQLVECGPGKVLSGLIRRIDKALEVFSTYSPELLNEALQVIHQ